MLSRAIPYKQTEPPFLLVGCYAGVNIDLLGENWKGFSHDGRFEKENFIAAVAGYEYGVGVYPSSGHCYEMVVEYEGESELCFYTGYFQPLYCWGSDSWTQETPELRLMDNSTGVREIPVVAFAD